MTVIAFDTTHIAWDGLATAGNEIFATDAEKVKVIGDVVYGFAGDLGIRDVMIGWHQRGAKQQEFNRENGRLRHYADDEYTLLVVTRAEAAIFTNDVHFRTRVPDVYAIGSGAQYARGALLARASAYRAVKIAAALDTSCGGDISVLNFTTVWPGGRTASSGILVPSKTRRSIRRA